MKGSKRRRLIGGGVAAAVAAIVAGGVVLAVGQAQAGVVPVTAATASAHDGNVPANAIDGNLSTRWSAEGDGQWIRLDLGQTRRVNSVAIAWYQGNARISQFHVDASLDAAAWTLVSGGGAGGMRSSGTTTGLECVVVWPTDPRYVRITGFGNNLNEWNSITEIKVYDTGNCDGATTPPTTSPPTTPPPTGAVTHGEQLTRELVGPVGTLTRRPGFTTTVPLTLSSVQINGNVKVRHDFTCTDCRIIGSGGYAVDVTGGNGSKFKCVRCEIIQRTATTKAVVSYGNGGIWLERSILRGGEDNYYGKPSHSHYTVDGVAYGHVFIETMFTDLQRHTGSHSDTIQIDGGAGGVLILRSKVLSYNIPEGSDPLTTTADGSLLGGGGVILTYPSTNPTPISKVHLRNTWFDGGNYTVDTSPPDGPAPTDIVITGNKWGLKHRHGALRGPRGTGNTWGQSGQTLCNGSTVTVTAGSPLSC